MPRTSRRRRRQQTPSPKFLGILILALLALFACSALATALQNQPLLILPTVLIPLAIVAGYVAWRIRSQQRQIRARAAYEQQQREMEYAQQEEQARQRDYEEQRRLQFAQSIGNFLALTPREFELTVGSILKGYGYREVKHTGQSGDLAADLHAISPQGEYVIIQCKRFAPGNSVGTPEIQKFIGMMTVHHGAQSGIFVTTSVFTKPARDTVGKVEIIAVSC